MDLLYNVHVAIPDDCYDCIQPNHDGIAEIQTYLAEKYPKASFGLFGTTRDVAIRKAMGPGQDDCLGLILQTPLPLDVYQEALIELRDNHLLPSGRWSTYFKEADSHGITLWEDTDDNPENPVAGYFDTSVNDVPFTDWLKELINGVPDPVEP